MSEERGLKVTLPKDVEEDMNKIKEMASTGVNDPERTEDVFNALEKITRKGFSKLSLIFSRNIKYTLTASPREVLHEKANRTLLMASVALDGLQGIAKAQRPYAERFLKIATEALCKNPKEFCDHDIFLEIAEAHEDLIDTVLNEMANLVQVRTNAHSVSTRVIINLCRKTFENKTQHKHAHALFNALEEIVTMERPHGGKSSAIGWLGSLGIEEEQYRYDAFRLINSLIDDEIMSSEAEHAGHYIGIYGRKFREYSERAIKAMKPLIEEATKPLVEGSGRYIQFSIKATKRIGDIIEAFPEKDLARIGLGLITPLQENSHDDVRQAADEQVARIQNLISPSQTFKPGPGGLTP